MLPTGIFIYQILVYFLDHLVGEIMVWHKIKEKLIKEKQEKEIKEKFEERIRKLVDIDQKILGGLIRMEF